MKPWLRITLVFNATNAVVFVGGVALCMALRVDPKPHGTALLLFALILAALVTILASNWITRS